MSTELQEDLAQPLKLPKVRVQTVRSIAERTLGLSSHELDALAGVLHRNDPTAASVLYLSLHKRISAASQEKAEGSPSAEET